MKDFSKRAWLVDVQSLPERHRSAIIDVCQRLCDVGSGEWGLQHKGHPIPCDFGDFFYKEKGQWVRNTEDYDPEYFELFDLLNKYVPADKLRKGILLKVWW
jgi:hypothetical protein